jgi:hypothetical protein
MLFVLFSLALPAQSAEEKPAKEEILKHIFETAKANDKITEIYGFYQQNTVRKLSDEGKVKKQQTRVYRTIWLNGAPYAELIRIDGRPLSKKETDAEKDRRKKFLKGLNQKKEKDDDDDEDFDITWQDFYQKYQFVELAPEGQAVYVFTATPKGGKQKERNRIEKVFNHLSGKFWADKDFNLLRAEARLQDNVKFGWGLLAKVEQLQLQYTQQPYQKVWLPATLHLAFQATIALLKTERQEIDTRFYDPFPRPGSHTAASATP